VVASAVATAAWDTGVATVLPRPLDIAAHCRSHMYVPAYF
jgi:hypothetical protein